MKINYISKKINKKLIYKNKKKEFNISIKDLSIDIKKNKFK